MSLPGLPQKKSRSRQHLESHSRAESINYDFVVGLNQDAATRLCIRKRVMHDYLNKKQQQSASFLQPNSHVSLGWRVKQQDTSINPSHVARPRSSSSLGSLAQSTTQARTRLGSGRTSKSRPLTRTCCRASSASSAPVSAAGLGQNAYAGQAIQPPEVPQNCAKRVSSLCANAAEQGAGAHLSPVTDSRNRLCPRGSTPNIFQVQSLDQSALPQSPPAVLRKQNNLASEAKRDLRDSQLAYKQQSQELLVRHDNRLVTSPLPPSPRTMLGAGRMNPFATYPIECGPIDHLLCDFHTFSLGEFLYGYSETAPLCHFRLIHSTTMQDAAVFHLTLAFSGYRYASLLGGSQKHEIAALSHKVEGMRLVNERITDPANGACNANIQAAIILGGIEARLGNSQEAKKHWLGLKQMVKMRGGLCAFHDDLLMMWQVSWIDLSHSDKLAMDYMAFNDRSFTEFTRLQAKVPESSVVVSNSLLISEENYFRICCQEFTIHLRKFQTLSLARKSVQPNANVFKSSSCASVEYAFKPGSPLHQILYPPAQSQPSSQHDFYSPDAYRLACLFHIHSALYAYKDLPSRTDAYIAHLQSQVAWNNLDRSHSLEGLSFVVLWVLLTERDDPMQEKLEITRLVLRLMKVSRRLTSHSWRSLEQVLFQWLCPKYPELRFAFQCDPEQICSEALSGSVEG